jgi:hypothetical protein
VDGTCREDSIAQVEMGRRAMVWTFAEGPCSLVGSVCKECKAGTMVDAPAVGDGLAAMMAGAGAVRGVSVDLGTELDGINC